MKLKGVLKAKSLDFAVTVYPIAQQLTSIGQSDIGNQLFRSSSSISANIHEAQFASSRKDFIHKMHIALKEANESLFWIELIARSASIEKDQSNSIRELNVELIKMLTASINTAKKNSKTH